jgi:hypothetical protein
MRDPAHIDHVLSVVREVWLRNPQLRLGQLLISAAKTTDIFSIEDMVLAGQVHKLGSRPADASSKDHRDAN